MSRPRSLDLPPGVTATRVETARGSFAALVATPARPGSQLDSPPETHRATRAPAVLVPGFTGSKEDFLAVLAPLAASGRRVVAIDQRGQHETAGTDDRAAYALGELAADAMAVAAALGGPVHLVGHSFGGFVARSAIGLPGADGLVASLTLLGSGPGRVTGAATLADLALLGAALPEHDLETIWRVKRTLEREHGEPDPAPEIEAFLHARFVGTHPTALTVAAEQLLADEDRVVALVGTAVPVQVVSGSAEDVWSAAELQAMAARLAVRCTVIDSAGHSPAVDDPDATARALVEFWDAVERPVG